jgi:hypothetical protein
MGSCRNMTTPPEPEEPEEPPAQIVAITDSYVPIAPEEIWSLESNDGAEPDRS